MAKNRGTFEKKNKKRDNFDNYDIVRIYTETGDGIDNLRAITIDSNLSEVHTRSDLMVHQTGLTYGRDIGQRRKEIFSSTLRQSVDYSNTDWGETFQRGGLSGMLDKLLGSCTNMTSGQKDTWKTLGVLGCFAGGIFGLYKFFTSDKLGFWSKAGITGLTIFGSQALTGEGPVSLFTKLITGGFSTREIKNKFGNVVGGLSSSGSEVAETTVPAIQSMMVFNSGATVGDIRDMTSLFRKNNKNRNDFYQQSCTKIQGEYGISAVESFQANFSNNYDEKKWNDWLASFGVTGSTNSREPIYGLAHNAEMNKTVIEKFLEDNKLRITTDLAKKTEFDNYVLSKNERNESIKIVDLQAHINDWFIPINSQSNPNHENSEQQNPNPQNPEQQNNQNIELTNETLKPAVEKGLSIIFNHFKSEYGFIVSKIGIKQSTIPEYSPGITNDIISNVCQTNGKAVILDLSDNNIKQVYNNFINKLANNHSGPIKSKIESYDWNGLNSKLSDRKIKGKTEKCNKRKNNFSVIFNSLFNEIIPVIQSQGGEIKITSNGQEFNNVNDAITSLQILNNSYS